jgi:MOSC domain-containing protein
MTTQIASGAVVSLWRYPVKSMLGEELSAALVTARGLRGDRAYALVDRTDGKVASAKNPRRWPNLFKFRAALIDPAGVEGRAPVRITLPDGSMVTSEADDCNQMLSRALAREVALEAVAKRHEEASSASAIPAARAEGYWPDMEGLDFRDTVTEFTLPVGTFFDGAVLHVLTTATLDRLGELYPQGRFDARRFRPNIVVQPTSRESGFTENAWIGHTLAIGDDVRLSITRPCGRCVMTTLPQGDLPGDLNILRTLAQHNEAKAGVYAAVTHGGTIRRGDPVRRVA